MFWASILCEADSQPARSQASTEEKKLLLFTDEQHLNSFLFEVQYVKTTHFYCDILILALLLYFVMAKSNPLTNTEF